MRELICFLVGYATSISGTWLRFVAIGWIIRTELELESNMFALYTGLSAVASFITNPLAANILRITSRRKVLIIGNYLLCLNALIIGLLCYTKSLNFIALLFFGVISHTCSAFIGPAEDSFLRELANDNLLRHANHARELLTWGTRIVFAYIAGVLLEKLGADALFLFDAGSFLVMVICLHIIKEKPMQSPATLTIHKKFNPLPMLTFMKNDKTTRMICKLNWILNSFAFISLVLLPSIIKNELKGTASDYSIVISLSGLGGVLGLICSWYFHPKGKMAAALFVSFHLAIPFSLALVGYSQSAYLAAFGYGIAIFSSAQIVVICKQYLQKCQERSYALGAYHLSSVLASLTTLAITAAATVAQIRASTLLIGCCCFALVLLLITLASKPSQTRSILNDLSASSEK